MSVQIEPTKAFRKTIQCMCPLNPVLSEADTDQLEALARKVVQKDRRLFNTFRVGPNNATPGTLLSFQRSVNIPGVGQIQHCPFIVRPNMLEFGLLFQLPESPKLSLDAVNYDDPSGFNKLACELIESFMTTIGSIDILRVGKIYNYHFGPFEPGEALAWMSERFMVIKFPPDCGTLADQTGMLVARVGDKNVNLLVGVERLVQGGELVRVTLDINNSDTTRALDTPKIRQVLDFASAYHSKEFWEIFKGEAQ